MNLSNQEVSFEVTGYLPGGDLFSGVLSVSGDGSFAVGGSISGRGPAGEAFRFSSSNDELMGLGDLPGSDFNSVATSISRDGSVIAGPSFSGNSANSTEPTEAFRWTEESGMVALGDLPGGEFSSFAFALSSDGTAVVGSSSSEEGVQAFRWTEESGMVALGDLPGGEFNSVATATSSDGSTVVGFSTGENGVEGFRWTEDTGMIGVGDLPGGLSVSRVADISDDGKVLVGNGSSKRSADSLGVNGSEAFRWSEDRGIVGLGDLPGGDFFSEATAVSSDGAIVVGRSMTDLGLEPFIWSEAIGMRSLTDLLTGFGAELSSFADISPQDISDDGTVIGGLATNQEGNTEGWVAQLPAIKLSSNVFLQLGTSSNDQLIGTSSDDTIAGGLGQDTLSGSDGNDRIWGAASDDFITGGLGNDEIYGGSGDDTVLVHNFKGIDTFDGGAGNDSIRFEPADDRNLTIFLDRGVVGDFKGGGQFFQNFEQIATGQGNDRLLGNEANNTLDGNDGDDIILGRFGKDSLVGGQDNDTLIGGQGNDLLNGGQGNDVLLGGAGFDTYQFDQTLLDGLKDTDTISTFESHDVFDFSGYLGTSSLIEVTRVSSGFLRIDLNQEDAIQVFGHQSGLDAAESQLSSILS